MTESFQVTKYRCAVCKQVCDTEAAAAACEEKPITQDRGVKVGDVVRVTSGAGAGLTATVESVFIIDREWGHYAWQRYWHTIGLTAKLNDHWGDRILTFDAYEVMP